MMVSIQDDNYPVSSTTIKIEIISEGGRTIVEFIKPEKIEELKKEPFFRALLCIHNRDKGQIT